MSTGSSRAFMVGSVVGLIVIASAFGFIYLQTSSSLEAESNTISTLYSEITSYQSVVASLSSNLSANTPTTVTLTKVSIETTTTTAVETDLSTQTLTDTNTVTNIVTDTSTNTVTKTIVSTPLYIPVTRKITFFIGNTTSRLGAPDQTVRIYNSSGWVDTTVTNPDGMATTHVLFTSGQVLRLCVISPRGTTNTFSVRVPMESQTDALALRHIFIALYVS